MTTNILFLCPHNAAKSVIATALCQREASRRGMELSIDLAGTEPDEFSAPPVIEMLAHAGMDMSGQRPRGAQPEDFLKADWVVSMGCDVSAMIADAATLQRWNHVPAPSEDLGAAYAHIEQAVGALLNDIQANDA